MAGRVGYDPETGKLTLDGKPIENLYGSIGRNVTDVSTGDVGFYRSQPGAYDPQFYEQYDMGGSEGSSNVGYRLRPEIQQELGGKIQIGGAGVGGPGEVIDWNKVEISDKYGLLTEPSNIKAPQDSMLDRMIGPIVAALINPAVAMGSGSLFQAGGLLGGAEAGAANLAPGGPSGSAAFGTPGFGGSEWADLLATTADKPAMFGTPGFGAGESFFGADVLGLGGGGGALGTGTSLAGTGLGAGTVTGPLGSGFSLAGTGLAPGVVTGTGAVAGGGASFLDRLLEKAPQLLQALPGVTAALSGPPKLPGAGGGAGGSSLGAGGGGGSRAGRVEVETNPWLKAKPRDVLDLMSYIGGRK